MTATKPSSDETVLAELASVSDATAPDLAAATGLGRSTVGKVLARLERDGRALHRPGERRGARRLPDRWSFATEKADAQPQRAAERLRPGEMDGLVLAYLRQHAKSGPLGPAAVAKGLGRSSGAVGNCLARLAAAGRVRQVSERARRYSAP